MQMQTIAVLIALVALACSGEAAQQLPGIIGSKSSNFLFDSYNRTRLFHGTFML